MSENKIFTDRKMSINESEGEISCDMLCMRRRRNPDVEMLCSNLGLENSLRDVFTCKSVVSSKNQ